MTLAINKKTGAHLRIESSLYWAVKKNGNRSRESKVLVGCQNDSGIYIRAPTVPSVLDNSRYTVSLA